MIPLSPKTIRNRIAKADALVKKIVSRANSDYMAEIATVRSRCVHAWTYFGDPAGGFDSFWACSVCDLSTTIDPHRKD